MRETTLSPDYKCPYCGSSLVGGILVCPECGESNILPLKPPGKCKLCGADLSEAVFSQDDSRTSPNSISASIDVAQTTETKEIEVEKSLEDTKTLSETTINYMPATPPSKVSDFEIAMVSAGGCGGRNLLELIKQSIKDWDDPTYVLFVDTSNTSVEQEIRRPLREMINSDVYKIKPIDTEGNIFEIPIRKDGRSFNRSVGAYAHRIELLSLEPHGTGGAPGAYRIPILGYVNMLRNWDIIEQTPNPKYAIIMVRHMGGGTGSVGGSAIFEIKEEVRIPDCDCSFCKPLLKSEDEGGHHGIELTGVLVGILPGKTVETLQEFANASFSLSQMMNDLREGRLLQAIFIDNTVIDTRLAQKFGGEMDLSEIGDRTASLYFAAINNEISRVIDVVLSPFFYGLKDPPGGRGNLLAILGDGVSFGSQRWACPFVCSMEASINKEDEEKFPVEPTLLYYIKHALKYGALCSGVDLKSSRAILPIVRAPKGFVTPNAKKEVMRYLRSFLDRNTEVLKLVDCTSKDEEKDVSVAILAYGCKFEMLDTLVESLAQSRRYISYSWFEALKRITTPTNPEDAEQNRRVLRHWMKRQKMNETKPKEV